jgi:hypothetical protein
MSLLRIRQQGIDFSDNSRMQSLFDIIPSGTKFLIHSSTAPTGWTKRTDNSFDNAALRIVSQTGWVSNTQVGRTKFTQAFKEHQKSYTIQSSISQLQVGNHTLSTPQIPQHSHNMPNAGGGAAVAGSTPSNQGGDRANMSNGTTGQKGGGGQHSHPVSYGSVTGPLSTNHNIAVRYVDVILCAYNGFTTSGTADSGS